MLGFTAAFDTAPLDGVLVAVNRRSDSIDDVLCKDEGHVKDVEVQAVFLISFVCVELMCRSAYAVAACGRR